MGGKNRIVVDYGDMEDLVLLGMIHTETGYEVDLHSEGSDVRFKNLINNLGITIVKKYDGIRDYTELKGMIGDNEEGFVVRFKNGDRMKVKGVEYLRLHKIMTNISTTSIWEMLSTGQDVTELLKDVPDEFFDKIKTYVKKLRYQKMAITEHAGKLFDSYYESYDGELPEKSKYAQWVLKMEKHLQPILFRMYDRKDYETYVWKLIKPEFKKL